MEQQTECKEYDNNLSSKDSLTFYDNISGVLRRTKNEGQRSTKSRENCKAMIEKSCKSGRMGEIFVFLCFWSFS